MTRDWKQTPARALAYVGDAVYELHIRERGLRAGGRVDTLHRATVQRVRAEGQATVARWLYERLSEEEQGVFRRARNTKGPRAGQPHYRLSTAFEAVLGYLHLKGDTERLQELLAMADAYLESPAPAHSEC